MAQLPLALLPLSAPPVGQAWNLAELAELLPNEGRSLRPAAVLVGLVERVQGVQVLLTRRTESLRHHGGQVSFPGGMIESGDADPVAAALREAHEEVGLLPSLARPQGYLDPFATITGFHVYPVVARVDAEFVAARDPAEVEEVFEVPLDFLLDPTRVQHVEMDFRGRKRRLVEFHYRNYRIWGATAAMLVNFRERLERTT